MPSGTITFAAGVTTQTITINVNGDTVVEPNDGFTVTLSNEALFSTFQPLGFMQTQLVSIPIKLPVIISVDNDSYVETITIVYKSSGKSGSASKINEGGVIPGRR